MPVTTCVRHPEPELDGVESSGSACHLSWAPRNGARRTEKAKLDVSLEM